VTAGLSKVFPAAGIGGVAPILIFVSQLVQRWDGGQCDATAGK
jgi:hypothetical protein